MRVAHVGYKFAPKKVKKHISDKTKVYLKPISSIITWGNKNEAKNCVAYIIDWLVVPRLSFWFKLLAMDAIASYAEKT